MADENNIGGKVGLDITDFKANVTELNRQIRVIDSGFKAAAAGMDDWGKSEEGLRTRIDALNQVTDLQRKKVENLSEIYKKVVEDKGENSKAAQDLQVRINKETESLNKNERELRQCKESLDSFGKEAGDAGNEVGQLGDEMNQAADKSSKLKGILKGLTSGLASGVVGTAKVTAKTVAGLAVAAAGAAVGIFKMAQSAGETADDLLTLSAKTGLTTKQLQEMQYASRFVDVDLDVMTGSMIKLTKSMDGAKGGSKEAQNAFKRLGISVTGQNGQLRDSKDVWTEAIGALGKMPNETERNALAMKIFGKSAAELNPLIVAGADELKKLGKEANDMGVILSEDALTAMGKFDDQMQKFQATTQTLGPLIGSVFLPAVNAVATEATKVAGGIAKTLSDGFQEGDLNTIANILTGMLQKVVAGIATYVPKLVPVLVSAITGLIGTIVKVLPTLLPPLLQGAIQLLNGLVSLIQQNAQPIANLAVYILTEFIKFIGQALPQLLIVAVQIIISLVNGISSALPQLIPIAIQAILTLVQGLLSNLPQLVDAAINLALAIIDGLINGLPLILEQAPQIIETIITGIIIALPKLIDASIKIITKLCDFIVNNLPLIATAAVKIVVALVAGLIKAVPQLVIGVIAIAKSIKENLEKFKWKDIGINIIEGIANGLKGAAGKIAQAAKDAAKSALESAKRFLGIHSPSTVMRDQVGAMIGAGMAEGIENSQKQVNSAMAGLNQQIASDGSIDVDPPSKNPRRPSSSGSSSGNGEVYTIIKVPVSVDGKVIAEAEAPYSDKIQGSNLALAGRGRGLK
jgi:hypothetical protein